LSTDPAFTATATNDITAQTVVTKVAAQEIVHVTTIKNLLTRNGATLIQPYTALVPVIDNADFLVKANIITSASIGAISSLSASIAITDLGLVIPTSMRADMMLSSVCSLLKYPILIPLTPPSPQPRLSTSSSA